MSLRCSFIFPYYYHYYCYYYFISVWLLVKVRKEDKNGKRCVHPLLNSDREAGTKTSRVGGKQGGRPARKRYQLVANRLAERSKPYSARLTGKRRQTDQKTQKLHEHIHPGIGHSAVKPLWPLLILSLALPSSGSSSWLTYYKLTTTCQHPVIQILWAQRISELLQSLNWVKTTVFSV